MRSSRRRRPKGKGKLPSTLKNPPDWPRNMSYRNYRKLLVMWGNTLFEQSQMRAKTGEPWRPLLDQAVEKFKEAGCAQADIDQALKVHRGVRNEAK